MCGQMRHTKGEDLYSNRQSSMAAFKSTAAEEETISTEYESWSDTSELEMMALAMYHFCSILQMLKSCVQLMLMGCVPFFSHVWSICYNQWFTKGDKCQETLIKQGQSSSFFAKSSFATPKSLEQHNLVVTKDRPTWWLSTYNMIAWLLQLKDWVCQIVNDRIRLLNLYWMSKIWFDFHQY